jgi:hypothetical protein
MRSLECENRFAFFVGGRHRAPSYIGRVDVRLDKNAERRLLSRGGASLP